MMESELSLPESLELDNPLWRFAITAWRIPEVEQGCLALQAKQWSVTRILVACWQASQGQCYESEDESVTRWRQQVTGPLRALKKQMPRNFPALSPLREQLAGAELAAEKVELALAYAALRQPGRIEGNAPAPEKLAHLNLQSASPTPIIDLETSRLLEALVDQMPLESKHGANRP